MQGQGQMQGQIGINKQGQKQGQNNDQTIAPEQSQSVTFKSPTQLMNPPSQYVPELNFGNGQMKDATNELPKFALYGIRPLDVARERILGILSVNANVKFKNLYESILEDAGKVAGKSKGIINVRYQVMRAEAQKSWTTGGNLGGAGSGLSATGLGGGSGAGSIIPQWGGTKADDLFTIIFMKIIND
jgi:hypothetical protein